MSSYLKRYCWVLLLVVSDFAFAVSNVTTDADKSDGMASGFLWRLSIGLLIILLLIIGLAVIVKPLWGFKGRTSAGMSIVGSLPVGQRERLVLVQIGDEQLLIGVAQGSIKKLHTLPIASSGIQPMASDAPAITEGTESKHSFSDRLADLLKKSRVKS